MSLRIQHESSAQWHHFGILKPKLCKIFFEIVEMCDEMDREVIITSLVRPKTIDTGIHSLARAIDFILDVNDDLIVNYLTTIINKKYIYDSDRPTIETLIWHSSVGAGAFANKHFHLQCAAYI